MAKRPTPREPQSPTLTRQQLETGKAKLERRIAELQSVDIAKLTGDSDPALAGPRTDIQSTLSDIFGHDTVEEKRFRSAAFFHSDQVINMGGGFDRGTGPNYERMRQGLRKSIETNVATLRSAVKLLCERLEEHPSDQIVEDKQAKEPKFERRIFIVHGHDEAVKQSVARFLEQMNFQPIILHEQANRGMTVIEKFEGNRDVGFAVVLLTPDDECITPTGNKRRARQNVILELGYFISRLGRERVAALKKGDVELPSDMIGIVYTDFDDRGAWKMELARELKEAGYAIALPL